MKLDVVDISKTASAASIVFDALRKAIVEGGLKVGEPLRQDEIAKLFNTSRIPVREAISRLEEQGLVKTQRYKGAVVAGFEPDEVAEIFDFRALLESHVIAAAALKMSKADIAEAKACCEAFGAADDPTRWGDLNRAFHHALYAPSGLDYHLSMIESSLDRVDRYIRAQLALSDGLPRAHSEHLAILAACETGDAEQAARLTREHVLGVRDSLISHLPPI